MRLQLWNVFLQAVPGRFNYILPLFITDGEHPVSFKRLIYNTTENT
jgi:hypothetical protein